jgi:hypothetical protein
MASLSATDLVVVGVLALVTIAGAIVAGIRALWIYRAPPWLRRTLLGLGAIGLTAAAVGFLTGAELLGIGGLALALLPFGGWFVVRSISYTGPPPGLLKGPKALDAADDILDSVSHIVVPPRSSDHDDA